MVLFVRVEKISVADVERHIVVLLGAIFLKLTVHGQAAVQVHAGAFVRVRAAELHEGQAGGRVVMPFLGASSPLAQAGGRLEARLPAAVAATRSCVA